MSVDYKGLAKEASLNFIKNDIPLDKSITKIADDYGLNSEGIRRISELSNKAVHQYCLLKTADKNFTFKLANSDLFVCSLIGILSSFDMDAFKLLIDS